MQKGNCTFEDLTNDPREKWQRWIVLLIVVGLIGVLLAIYRILTDPLSSFSRHQVAGLIPPVLFGLISLAVLASFYLSQTRTLVRVLQEGLLRERMETELSREFTLLDPVTEVYNRRYLRTLLEKEISRAKRHKSGLSVMLVDIARFRRVNESLGPTAADAVLKEIAHLLQQRTRNSDCIVRYGGDEFLLILPEADPTKVSRLGERLRHALDEWLRQNNMSEFRLTFAVGISHYQSDEPIDQLLSRAERQMLQKHHASDTSSNGEKALAVSAS